MKTSYKQIDPTEGSPASVIFRDCLSLFQALGDPARQDIILLLADAQPLNVKQIAQRIPLSRPTISHHLKTLRTAGLVSAVRQGTENCYSLQIDDALARLKDLVRFVEQSCT